MSSQNRKDTKCVKIITDGRNLTSESKLMPQYDYPLYRPPSEAKSLIFQVTLGCSFNKCSFCDMYRSKEYQERSWEDIKSEIDLMAGHLPDTKRIFLADGDAMNLSTERITQILDYIYQKFPGVERISAYAMPKNLIEKKPEELAEIYNRGLNMLYLGIESGSDTILKKVTKGASSNTIIKACNKAKDAGFTLSCMIILGLGGKKYSKEHILGTAKVAGEASPDYLAALTLYLENGIKEEFLQKFGEPFEPIDDEDALDELELLVNTIQVKSPVIFRANHGSNAYPIKGTLPEEKDQILKHISYCRKNPEVARPAFLRGF